MATGAPPPNQTFQSSKRIAPSVHIGPRSYNNFGIVPHPMEIMGQVPQNTAGAFTAPAGTGPNLTPGGQTWDMGGPHTVHGRDIGKTINV
jgi:hypothetical protein